MCLQSKSSYIRQKKYMSVSGFLKPRFLLDPKHFIVQNEQNIDKYSEKWGEIWLKSPIYIIKC